MSLYGETDITFGYELKVKGSIPFRGVMNIILNAGRQIVVGETDTHPKEFKRCRELWNSMRIARKSQNPMKVNALMQDYEYVYYFESCKAFTLKCLKEDEAENGPLSERS